MTLEIHIPQYPLNAFIGSLIYYRDFTAVHNLDRLLPDGNVTLIIDLKDASQGIYDNETLVEIQSCRHTWLSGVRSAPITIPSGRDSEMLIVNFVKGRAFPFLQNPLHIYTDHVVNGDVVFGRDLMDCREQIIEAVSISEKFRLIESFLLNRLGCNPESNPFVDYAVERILASPGNAAISALSDKVGFSQKHFIDLFKTHLGMTPKGFMRVARFQQVIQDIERRATPDWKHLAFDTGYYDHAHFIHDFRHFSGLTPQQYFAAKNGQLNYIPVG